VTIAARLPPAQPGERSPQLARNNLANNKDIVWQDAVNIEMRRLRRTPAKLLHTLDRYSTRTVRHGGETIDLARIHEVSSVDLPLPPGQVPDTEPRHADRKSRARRPQVTTHSFIVRAERKVFFLFGQRTYVRGFALNEAGKVIAIDPALLRTYK
jgi:hypothetical protein